GTPGRASMITRLRSTTPQGMARRGRHVAATPKVSTTAKRTSESRGGVRGARSPSPAHLNPSGLPHRPRRGPLPEIPRCIGAAPLPDFPRCIGPQVRSLGVPTTEAGGLPTGGRARILGGAMDETRSESAPQAAPRGYTTPTLLGGAVAFLGGAFLVTWYVSSLRVLSPGD